MSKHSLFFAALAATGCMTLSHCVTVGDDDDDDRPAPTTTTTTTEETTLHRTPTSTVPVTRTTETQTVRSY